MVALRETVADMVSDAAVSRRATLYRTAEIFLVGGGIVAMILATSPMLTVRQADLALDIVAAVMGCLTVDWLLRLWSAPGSLKPLTAYRARLRWVRSSAGVFGLIAVLPMAVAAPFDWTPGGATLFAVFWVFRFAHYSKGIAMLLAVLARESGAVLGVLFAFAAILLFGSVGAFLLEHEAQPDKFGSVPSALWWAVTTLTTTGYGDVVPVTALGRMLGGLMMIAGIIVFGLLAGILATGFSQEVRRQEFLRNWDLVKQVPIFQAIGHGLIADLAALLRPRDLPARAVLWRRGDLGQAMFFIVSGEVAILIEPPLKLGAGSFFGELALLNDEPRTATVVTTQACQLLELDIADFPRSPRRRRNCCARSNTRRVCARRGMRRAGADPCPPFVQRGPAVQAADFNFVDPIRACRDWRSVPTARWTARRSRRSCRRAGSSRVRRQRTSRRAVRGRRFRRFRRQSR